MNIDTRRIYKILQRMGHPDFIAANSIQDALKRVDGFKGEVIEISLYEDKPIEFMAQAYLNDLGVVR